MIRLLFAIALWCGLLAGLWSSAHAVPIIADISSHRVEIHSSFTGTQLLVFGVRNDPGDIVIVIRGPERELTVRKKERFAGIWVNREQQTFAAIPEFYRIASSKPLIDIKQHLLFSGLSIDPLHSAQAPDEPFRDALRNLLVTQQYYTQETAEIEFMGPSLFKAVFDFPDNMPRGTYIAEAYLFSDGLLSGAHVIPLHVYKVGSDAFLYDAAHQHSILYGLFAVAIALFFGFSASWLFKRMS